MVGVQILQEQKSAYRPGMVGVQILQEQKSAYRPGMVGVQILSGTKICLPSMDGGSADCRSCASRARGIHAIRGNIVGSKNRPTAPTAEVQIMHRYMDVTY